MFSWKIKKILKKSLYFFTKVSFYFSLFLSTEFLFSRKKLYIYIYIYLLSHKHQFHRWESRKKEEDLGEKISIFSNFILFSKKNIYTFSKFLEFFRNNIYFSKSFLFLIFCSSKCIFFFLITYSTDKKKKSKIIEENFTVKNIYIFFVLQINMYILETYLLFLIFSPNSLINHILSEFHRNVL